MAPAPIFERDEVGTLHIFISWSGERSKDVADKLAVWLRTVLDSTETWVSTSNIESGEVWLDRLHKELAESAFGIICLTKENVDNRWLHYEAGAIGKEKGRSRVCPYLIGISPSQVDWPLKAFQLRRAEKRDTLAMVRDFATHHEMSLDQTVITDRFDQLWDGLESVIKVAVEKEISEPVVAPTRASAEPGAIDDLIQTVQSLTREVAGLRLLSEYAGTRGERASDSGSMSPGMRILSDIDVRLASLTSMPVPALQAIYQVKSGDSLEKAARDRGVDPGALSHWIAFVDEPRSTLDRIAQETYDEQVRSLLAKAIGRSITTSDRPVVP
jgi:hypothetical protein